MQSSLDQYIGAAAGVATSFLWTLTVVLFTAGAKRIGPTFVNAARIMLAIVLHAFTYLALTGDWVPQAAPGQVLYLAASGVVGLSIGDQALITAFVDIGPRLTSVIMSTTPIFAVLLGWVVLNETLALKSGIGIVLVVAGVSWVVLERSVGDEGTYRPHRVRGIILAFVYSVCQAGGLLLSKQGIGHGWLPDEMHITPQAATLIRMVFAGAGMAPILAMNHYRNVRRSSIGLIQARSGSFRAGLGFAACGAVVGPYLGVWMSLVASDKAPLGIAQTLCSLVPIFILPLAAVIYKERISRRAVFGALLAVAGSAILFLR